MRRFVLCIIVSLVVHACWIVFAFTERCFVVDLNGCGDGKDVMVRKKEMIVKGKKALTKTTNYLSFVGVLSMLNKTDFISSCVV